MYSRILSFNRSKPVTDKKPEGSVEKKRLNADNDRRRMLCALSRRERTAKRSFRGMEAIGNMNQHDYDLDQSR